MARKKTTKKAKKLGLVEHYKNRNVSYEASVTIMLEAVDKLPDNDDEREEIMERFTRYLEEQGHTYGLSHDSRW